jgi:PD-(D/E)XK endonuclease
LIQSDIDRIRHDKPFPEPQPEESLTVTIQACAERTRKSRTRKSDGEASEAAFLARACALGFSVATPWGDSNRYDLLVDAGHGFWRVQVKSTSYRLRTRYVVQTISSLGPYIKADIDFLCAHIVPEDVWYVIPIEALGRRTAVYCNPQGSGRGMFEKYREAWCLLACESKARGWKDIPVLCRYPELNGHCAVCPLLK